MARLFPVPTCCLLLPYVWDSPYSVSVPCDCLKFFRNLQVELEKLNAATDEINKLELELDESMKTFHLLLNETSRRLQALTKRMGTCVDKSRPYYDAVGVAATARSECQKAAVQFQRASELHAAAKETVTLAEQRFVSKQDEWQFDSNWQEVLNHAIIKVMDAEKRKAESGREHQKKAAAYIAAERKVAQLEESLKRNIIKSRLYFEEKKLCDEQLQTQNEKIEKLQRLISDAKFRYSKSLKALEEISEEIHRRRGEYPPGKDSIPVGPREPGVGAERDPIHDEIDAKEEHEKDEESSLQELRLRVRELALKPIDRKEVETDEAWALELNETINKLDQLLMMKESNQQKRSKFTASSPRNSSAPSTSTNTGNKYTQPPSDSWKTESNLSRTKSISREVIFEHTNPPISKTEKSKSMMSLDVLALARDTAIMDRESYLKAVIEDKSPTGTYTESNSDRNESPDEILMVECDSSDSAQNPVIRMTSSVTDSDNS
ncbi:SH3 domain-binding protein 5 homolog isoform X1 [Galleria mellonella]|uniref:SH3 domain-binding protein 5 homolog isoform X1 n=1 Tax=Galleria mellonella TaxID=7137 RepID=A0ABM3N1L6_GALME|nr:SH3 domain-binding protein 5 homolog isoform X1 [Galleria mellonella]